MMQAVQHLGSDKIVGANAAPGTFMWHAYLQQIQAELQQIAEPIKSESPCSYQKMQGLGTGCELTGSTEIAHFSGVFATVNLGKTDSYDGAETIAVRPE